LLSLFLLFSLKKPFSLKKAITLSPYDENRHLLGRLRSARLRHLFYISF
jgi:hypothetical protein